MNDALRLRRFKDGEHGSGATELKQATAAGGDRLVVAAAGAEEVAAFVAAFAEALG